MVKIAPLALGIAFMLPGPGTAATSPCDRDLIPLEGAEGYQLRQGALCDGLFVSRVGAPPMEIVSVTRGGPLTGIAPEELDLSVLTQPSVGPLSLRAIGIPFRLYYRLDATIEPGQTVDWAPRRVLGPIGVPLQQIGIFAFGVDATGVPFYVPVTVGSARGGAAQTSAGPTIVALRTSALLEDLKWRFVPGGSPEPPGADWRQVAIAAGVTTLALPSKNGVLQLQWADSETGEAQQAEFSIEAGTE